MGLEHRTDGREEKVGGLRGRRAVGEGTAVGTAVAVADGGAVRLDEVPAQSRVWRIAASEEARTAARSRVIRFSYGRTEPEISFQIGRWGGGAANRPRPLSSST